MFMLPPCSIYSSLLARLAFGFCLITLTNVACHEPPPRELHGLDDLSDQVGESGSPPRDLTALSPPRAVTPVTYRVPSVRLSQGVTPQPTLEVTLSAAEGQLGAHLTYQAWMRSHEGARREVTHEVTLTELAGVARSRHLGEPTLQLLTVGAATVTFNLADQRLPISLLGRDDQVSRLTLTPAPLHLALGETQVVTPAVVYLDGRAQTLALGDVGESDPISWELSSAALRFDERSLSVSLTEDLEGTEAAINLTLGRWRARSAVTQYQELPSEVRIELTPEMSVGRDTAEAQSYLRIGERAQARAQARFSDGQWRDVSGAVQWLSQAPQQLRVDERGEVTALRRGGGEVIAVYHRLWSALPLQVIEPTAESPTAQLAPTTRGPKELTPPEQGQLCVRVFERVAGELRRAPLHAPSAHHTVSGVSYPVTQRAGLLCVRALPLEEQTLRLQLAAESASLEVTVTPPANQRLWLSDWIIDETAVLTPEAPLDLTAPSVASLASQGEVMDTCMSEGVLWGWSEGALQAWDVRRPAAPVALVTHPLTSPPLATSCRGARFAWSDQGGQSWVWVEGEARQLSLHLTPSALQWSGEHLLWVGHEVGVSLFDPMLDTTLQRFSQPRRRPVRDLLATRDRLYALYDDHLRVYSRLDPTAPPQEYQFTESAGSESGDEGGTEIHQLIPYTTSTEALLLAWVGGELYQCSLSQDRCVARPLGESSLDTAQRIIPLTTNTLLVDRGVTHEVWDTTAEGWTLSETRPVERSGTLRGLQGGLEVWSDAQQLLLTPHQPQIEARSEVLYAPLSCPQIADCPPIWRRGEAVELAWGVSRSDVASVELIWGTQSRIFFGDEQVISPPPEWQTEATGALSWLVTLNTGAVLRSEHQQISLLDAGRPLPNLNFISPSTPQRHLEPRSIYLSLNTPLRDDINLAEALQLISAGPDQVFNSDDDTVLELTGLTYLPSINGVRVVPAEPFAKTQYALSLRGAFVRDYLGVPLGASSWHYFRSLSQRPKWIMGTWCGVFESNDDLTQWHQIRDLNFHEGFELRVDGLPQESLGPFSGDGSYAVTSDGAGALVVTGNLAQDSLGLLPVVYSPTNGITGWNYPSQVSTECSSDPLVHQTYSEGGGFSGGYFWTVGVNMRVYRSLDGAEWTRVADGGARDVATCGDTPPDWDWIPYEDDGRVCSTAYYGAPPVYDQDDFIGDCGPELEGVAHCFNEPDQSPSTCTRCYWNLFLCSGGACPHLGYPSGDPICGSSSYGITVSEGGGLGEVMIGSANGDLMRSHDEGETWSRALTGAGPIKSIASNGQDTWVALGIGLVEPDNRAPVYSLDDGETWHIANAPALFVGDPLRDNEVRFGGGRFWAGGSMGQVISSVDGVTWTLLDDNPLYNNSEEDPLFFEIQTLSYHPQLHQLLVLRLDGQAALYDVESETWTLLPRPESADGACVLNSLSLTAVGVMP